MEEVDQAEWIDKLYENGKTCLIGHRNVTDCLASVSAKLAVKYQNALQEIDRDNLIFLSRIKKLKEDIECGMDITEQDRKEIIKKTAKNKKKFQRVSKLILKEQELFS